MHRGYSLLNIKAVDAERRIISGVATTPTPDRMGDIVEPLGVTFKNPLPLLLYHDARKPVGWVKFDTPSKAGIEFTARLPVVDEPGTVRDRIEEAWTSLKTGLIGGVSIGFRSLEEAFNKETSGFRFLKTEVLELSLVTIPAQADARIETIKSLDVGLVASDRPPAVPSTAGVPASQPKSPMKNLSEKITAKQAERTAIAVKMTALMAPVVDDDGSLTPEQQKEYDGHMTALAGLDAELRRLEGLERATAEKGLEPVPDSFVPNVRRVGNPKVNLPPGIEFARLAICKAAARLTGSTPMEIAKERFPDNHRIQMYLKAATTGAATTGTWGGQLLEDTITLPGEFLEYLRPQTIVGQFGTGGIPSLRRVPFNRRVQLQTGGGAANWVGQGIQKPVTSFTLDTVTLGFAKIAGIAVVSEELVRFSNPSAESIIRDALAATVIERLDRDFIDPDKSVSANVSPSSITNGITGLTPSTGGDAADVRNDVGRLVGAFITANERVGGLVWVMSEASALQLMLMRNSLGNREFPDIRVGGGTFEGFPVITSQYCAVVGSPTPNCVVLVNPQEIFLADDGGVTVDMSNEATIEMSDDPANDTGSQVNMFQTNNVALRAERYINWARGRTSAVAWLDAAAWTA